MSPVIRRTFNSIGCACGVWWFSSLWAQQDPLDTYLEEALESNAALRAQDLAVEAAVQGLRAARARHLPSLSLIARYTVASGGRTVEIPVGDALNPVYQTLNQLTAGSPNPAQFPQIGNQRIEFLREHEQDTRLSLTAPLYAPQIDAEVRIRAAQLDGSAAQREAFARTLVRDAKSAYYQLAQAGAGVSILEASRSALAEDRRVAGVLVDNGKATRDRLLRAEAELLAVEQRLRAAQNSERQARRYLNLLRNRDEAETAPVAELTNAEVPTAPDSLPRPELRGLDAQIEASAGARSLAAASYKPSLGLAADSGIQGESYRTDGESDVSTASLVLNWTLLDFGARRAAVASAEAHTESLRAQREDLARQLTLARQAAEDDLRTAQDALTTAQARQAAAEESFRIVERKRDAGQALAIEFLDAERALTEARLGFSIARYALLRAAAEREYAAAAYPLPAALVAGGSR